MKFNNIEPAKLKGWIAKNGASNEKTYMYIYDNNYNNKCSC